MKINISNETKCNIDPYLKIMEKSLEITLKNENFEKELDGAITDITIVDNNTIQSLNNQYRNINKPTDVLSFPLADFPIKAQSKPYLLGNIIISSDKVMSQGEEYGHGFERELIFLLVHGFLHLLGYTHNNREEEEKMEQKQEKVLESLGLGRI